MLFLEALVIVSLGICIVSGIIALKGDKESAAQVLFWLVLLWLLVGLGLAIL